MLLLAVAGAGTLPASVEMKMVEASRRMAVRNSLNR
jgi:hypothetical protein